MEKKTIVVFGGAFNPPTNSHFSLAEQICSEYDCVKKVLFVPVSDLYSKEGLLPAKHRVEMLRRVCDKNSKLGIDLTEVGSQTLLNTIDTLNSVQKEYPNYDIWFTIGTDNLKLIPSWKAYVDLISKYKLLVLERGEDVMEDIINASVELQEYAENFIKVKATVRSNGNSTVLRQKIREGKSIRYLVPDEVYFYIQEEQLYVKNNINRGGY